jgi:uncharacterized protein YecE (DUF72 family)
VEFGRVFDVNGIVFRLPPPHARSVNGLLLKGGPLGTFTLRIGCPVWNYKEWVGSIYPPNTPSEKFLFHYARRFAAIELNSTHYGIPPISTLRHWTESVGPEFRFCPKVPRALSHDTKLGSSKEDIAAFHAMLEQFGAQLGLPFLQLPPNFPAGALPSLRRFLEAYGKRFPLAVEFRHESWFHEGGLIDSAFNLLEEHGKSAVITDVAGRRDVLHACLPTDEALVRFVGNNLHPSDRTRLEAWADRIAEWKEQGLRALDFIVHQPSQLHAPALADYLEDLLRERHGIEAQRSGPAPETDDAPGSGLPPNDAGQLSLF